MWKNYLTVALRSLQRRKAYTFINVAGLGVGLACCFLIALFVREELSYDRFHEHSDRIVRVTSDWGDFSVPATNWPFVKAFQTEYPDIEVATLLRYGGPVRYEDRHFREPEIFYAGPALFDVFSFALQQGDPDAALAEPFTAVLSETAARKYFGDTDPVGQTLQIYGEMDATVTGVLAPLAGPSHVTPDFVLSWETLRAMGFLDSFGWGNNSTYTYLLLPDGTDTAALEDALPTVIERHAGDDWNGATLALQPLTRIHLYSQHNMELAANGRASTVTLFSAIALFILLLACVNFMNLATARSMERAREVGIRKSVGAHRGQLARQFLAEALVLAGLGLGVAVVLVTFALPLFRTLADRALVVDAGTVGPAVAIALGLTLLVGFVAGSYPALVLSRFRPAEVLKGAFSTSGHGALLRKGLVVFQFAISVALLIGTFVVYQQLGFLRSASLGFDEAQVMSVTLPEDGDGIAALVESLRARPEVLETALSSEDFPSELLDGNGTILAGVGDPGAFFESGQFVATRTVSVGHGFFETLDAKMAHGRAFDQAFPTDSGAYILNETAAQMLREQFPDHLASVEALVGRDVQVGNNTPGPLVGIVQDFNMATLHEAVEPVVFYIDPSDFRTLLVRVRPDAAADPVETLRAAWANTFPDALFEYRFTDAAFDAAYRSEARLSTLVTVFAGLAIFIACLGLFGLAAYAAEQRTKEIGVRKVLGATVPNIVVLLARDFVVLVLVAALVAAPVAYLAMDRWLDDFAYRVELGPMLFVGAGLVALVIALATVSGQALRAATTDPVKALRYE